MDLILSTVAVDVIAKYLDADDFLQLREVNSTCRSAFHKYYKRLLPIIIEKEDLVEFLSDDPNPNSGISEALVFNHCFSSNAHARLVYQICVNYPLQIKSLSFILSRGSVVSTKMYSILRQLRYTLETLKFRFVLEGSLDQVEPERPMFQYSGFGWLTLKLKKLVIIGKSGPGKETSDWKVWKDEEWVENFISFILESVPHLQHLRIIGFIAFQQTLFKEAAESWNKLKNLRCLELENVSAGVLEDLSNSEFVYKLTRLQLIIHETTDGKLDNFALSKALNELLQNIKDQLKDLDLRLGMPYTFSANNDGFLPMVPAMPKLERLTLANCRREDTASEELFNLQFECMSSEGAPSFRYMFRNLKEITLIWENGCDFTELIVPCSFVSRHIGVTLLRLDRRTEQTRMLEVSEKGLRKAFNRTFPNASVNFAYNSE